MLHPAPRCPRRTSRTAHALLVPLLLAVLAGCGGGGGAVDTDEPKPSAPLDGLRGRVLFEGQHLGRLAEAEPNDLPEQACEVPPLADGCVVEVAGTVAVDAATWGATDALDHLRFRPLGAPLVEFTLSFQEDDADGLGTNDVGLEVLDPLTYSVLASDAGSLSPLTVSAPAFVGAPLLVRVTAFAGHVPYVLRVETTLPSPLRKPGSPGRVATAGPDGPDVAPAAGDTAPFVADPFGGQRCSTLHVLAAFAPGADAEAIAAAEGLVCGRRLGGGGWCLGVAPEDTTAGEAGIARIVGRLSARPDVLWAEPDWVLKALGEAPDARFAEQWNLAVVGARGAWDLGLGDPGVVIGVIDTGQTDHPDLVGKFAAGHDFISSEAVAGDGNGRDNDPRDEGDHLLGSGLSTWHGTHLASILVARQDAVGISGLAPGCRVMALRAVGRGGGLVSDAADALLFAAGLASTQDGRRLSTPLRVVNLSVGVTQDSFVLRDACERAAEEGVLLVGAVGNEKSPSVLYPARYPSVMAVSAVDRGLQSTSYSNFGSEVEIAAPGGAYGLDRAGTGWSEAILGGVRDQTLEPAVPGYARLAGTSQAAPHVAAAAALLFSADPTMTAAEARALLRETARDLAPAGEDIGTGAGLLQVHEALRLALQRRGGLDPRLPRLGLGWTSLHLEGLEARDTVPMFNDGGGRLEIGAPGTWTLDGSPWLFAGRVIHPVLGASISHEALDIQVNRTLLPATGTWFTGIVTVRDTLGVPRGRVIVNVARGAWQLAGADYGVVAFDAASGGTFAPRSARATPEAGYRFWMTDLPAGTYHVRAGQDIDRDGFYCEAGDACGWWGGPTEAEATDLVHVPGEPAPPPGDVFLIPPP